MKSVNSALLREPLISCGGGAAGRDTPPPPPTAQRLLEHLGAGVGENDSEEGPGMGGGCTDGE